MKYTTFVGLDVHKDTIAVAVAKEGREAAESLGTIINSPEAIAKLVRKLGPAKNLYFGYEAGPCGYGIYRQLTSAGATCMVAAPSLIPRKPGERVKTDRRDAKKLAQLLRSGELTPVWVPGEKQEALRDLVRAREDTQEDILRKRNQISKFLLRLEERPPHGVKNWTIKYWQWLSGLNFSQAAQGIVLKEYIHALEEAQAREKRLEEEITELVKYNEHAPVIAALQALRGVGLITAVTVAAEAGDLSRFNSPINVLCWTSSQ